MIQDSPSGAALGAAPESFNKPVVPLADVVHIDQDMLKKHVGEVVLKTVEDALNGLLDAEADRLCNASRYEHKGVGVRLAEPLQLPPFRPQITAGSVSIAPAHFNSTVGYFSTSPVARFLIF
jgi:hypothetical protein